jgi:hypothetical protein
VCVFFLLSLAFSPQFNAFSGAAEHDPFVVPLCPSPSEHHTLCRPSHKPVVEPAGTAQQFEVRAIFYALLSHIYHTLFTSSTPGSGLIRMFQLQELFSGTSLSFHKSLSFSFPFGECSTNKLFWESNVSSSFPYDLASYFDGFYYLNCEKCISQFFSSCKLSQISCIGLEKFHLSCSCRFTLGVHFPMYRVRRDVT